MLQAAFKMQEERLIALLSHQLEVTLCNEVGFGEKKVNYIPY